MGIRSLTEQEFQAFPQEPALPVKDQLIDEREWFADEAGNVIGALFVDKIDHDWAYVVLGKHDDGLYRGVDVQHSLATEADARSALLEKITEYEASGTDGLLAGPVR